MAIGNWEIGSATVRTAGSSAQIKTGQGGLLGIYASVAGTANIYDGIGANGLVMSAIPIAAGWNWIPIAFGTGLYVALTTAAGSVVWA